MTPAERDDAIIRLLEENAAALRKLEETHDRIASTPAHDKHHQWLDIAIEREAQSVKFRQSIIEKSLTGVIWAGIVWLGLVFTTYLEAHGWKK